MPLIPTVECGGTTEPPEDACVALFDTGEAILEAAWSGLEKYAPQVGSPCFPGVERYVSLGAPPADTCDMLGVHLLRYDLAGGNTERTRALDRYAMQYVSEWSVDLWERCYPSPQEVDGRVLLPPLDLLHDINRHLYAHGIDMYNAVKTEFATPCENVVMGPLTPFAPLGQCAGWTFRVSLTH